MRSGFRVKPGSSAAAVASGLCATLLGIGLQRFGYAPLLPAMVEAGWATPGQAGTLGVANFFGYLLGAALAPALGRAAGMRPALRGAMLATAACLALCALPPHGFWWLLPWRMLAGIAGGVLMVLAGPAVQQAVPPALRGRAAGVMFSGVGLGTVAASLIVPAMLTAGLAPTWLALAGAGAGLAAFAWPRWPDVLPPTPLPLRGLPGVQRRLLLVYAFAAVAATPHMLFWPDFVARGLGRGTTAGAAFWLVWGVGAALGPATLGWLADRRGVVPAYRVGLVAQGLAVLIAPLPMLLPDLPTPAATAVLLAASLLGGASPAGLTAMTLACARTFDAASAPAVWRIGTAAYGAVQVATGFALTWMVTTRLSYPGMFALAAVATAVGLVAWRPAPPAP